MTIVGELYTLEERARTQALFSGVWGVASIAGPLVGGYITDALSWRWVFYLNLPFGLLAAAVIALAYPRDARDRARARVDWPGAALLFGGVTALLIALGDATDAGRCRGLAGDGRPARRVRRRRAPRRPSRFCRSICSGTAIVSRTLVVVFLIGMAHVRRDRVRPAVRAGRAWAARRRRPARC